MHESEACIVYTSSASPYSPDIENHLHHQPRTSRTHGLCLSLGHPDEEAHRGTLNGMVASLRLPLSASLSHEVSKTRHRHRYIIEESLPVVAKPLLLARSPHSHSHPRRHHLLVFRPHPQRIDYLHRSIHRVDCRGGH